MKLNVIIFSIFAVLSAVSLDIHAAASDRLNIVTVEMAPFGFFTKDKKSTGLLYDISNQIAEAAGIPYNNRIVPFARLIKELESGRADFGIFFLSKTNEKIAVKVAPVIPLENIVVGRKDTHFDSLKSLHGKTVATVRKAKYDEAFTSDFAIKKYETRSYGHSVRMLMNKRLDAMIGPKIGLYFTANRMGYSVEDLGIPLILNTKDTWLQFSRKKPDKAKIIAELKRAAERLEQNNIIRELADKYVRGLSGLK